MRLGRRLCIMLLAASIVALAGTAMAIPTRFTEDFTGPALDPAWDQQSWLPGHIGIVSPPGQYFLNAQQGGGFNPKLVRDTTDPAPLGSWNSEITFVPDTFFLTGGGGTQSDMKWKMFGSDGFMEIVLNSFSDMRLYHQDFNDAIPGGNIQPNTNIGLGDGDALTLFASYSASTDAIKFEYSINAGAPVTFFWGEGISGAIGDVVGNFVEVEVFKWGAVVDEPFVGIDEWNLIPEPSMIALFGLGGLALMASRRRK